MKITQLKPLKHLITLDDLNKKEIEELITTALAVKQSRKNSTQLQGKTVALLFEKQSTRTRLSFEAAMAQTGGQALYVDLTTTHIKKASLNDEIRCVSSYVDCIAARVYDHQQLVQMKECSTKPVINALSDLHHPTQALADVMTIKEIFGSYNVTVAYIGDGNNVCNSLIQACTSLGITLIVATPQGYEPLIKRGYTLTNDPKKAVEHADVVYTDTWVSMGQEAEKETRLRAFKGFMVTKKLLGKARIMHCLPAYQGYEVDTGIIDGSQSIVFTQAENKLHMNKAILLKLVG